MWKQVSAGAAHCCSRLWQAGYEAYPVGGCVRDLLLGRVPGDWDVTTSAKPEDIIELFDHTAATGVKHGTVTVIQGDEHIEVTAFRTEAGYSDGRHPDHVRFEATLQEDLARRDFTINAMALDRDGNIVDPFGGRADLERRLIRCVGEARRRFAEDALRMFRAVRFAAQLGFELEDKTLQAIYECRCNVKLLAAERVRVEVEKTLCSPRPERVKDFFDLDLLSPWTPERPGELFGLNRVAPRPLARWAGLCANLLRANDRADTEVFLRALKMDGYMIRACAAGEKLWRSGTPGSDKEWRRALAQYGEDGCRAGAVICEICGVPDAQAALRGVLAQKPCVSVGQLAVSGGQLAQLGLEGRRIGQMQRMLLEHVLDRPEDNRAEFLLDKAARDMHNGF